MSEGKQVKRWSAKRKQEVVLRLLRGESLDALSRETGLSAAVLSGWREEFLEAGLAGLKRRTNDPKVAALEKELKRAQRLVGDLMMDKELLEMRIARFEGEHPFPRRRSCRRGRKPAVLDEALAVAIRRVLSEAEALGFTGEGYRKVWARLRYRGMAVSKERVRRLMREHGLQAPHRFGPARGPKVHDGTIIPDAPNMLWGTDATQVTTRRDGAATVFVAVDHFVGDVVGIHAARPGTRFEALEPIHQGIREHFGPLTCGIAGGLALRHDHGSQYMSRHFQTEIAFLGIESSPSFVRAPEGNGVAERFIRTLKEQLLWVRSFDTVEELRQALLDFKKRYNRHWLLQRHGYATPAQVRAAHAHLPKAA